MQPNECWSCGKPGSVVAGKSWIRRCDDCDVAWSTEPANNSAARDRAWNRARQLEQLAAKNGLGNLSGFVDHGAVKLASPG